MLRRRRRQFATPFVFVVGCSQPAPTPAPKPAVPADAALALAAPDAAPDARPGRCELDPTAAGCNPPAPERATLNVHVLRVLGVQNGGLEFELGPYDESRHWRGIFVDDAGKEIAGANFTIISHTKQKALGRLTGASQLPAQRARLVEVFP